MVDEQKERQVIEGLAIGAEQVAVYVASYYQALIEKGFTTDAALEMAGDCAHLYFEYLFESIFNKLK